MLRKMLMAKAIYEEQKENINQMPLVVYEAKDSKGNLCYILQGSDDDLLELFVKRGFPKDKSLLETNLHTCEEIISAHACYNDARNLKKIK